MMDRVGELTAIIESHRCYSHPIFMNWAKVRPAPPVIGALFHQIQCFCAATRPGWSFPKSLYELGSAEQAKLLQEIVESEEDHGPELAAMAGHIVNRAAGEIVFRDLGNQEKVETGLKSFSDGLLSQLPGYDQETGLTVQARKAIGVFERRKQAGRDDTLRNLGAALALEVISNRHLIPGEKHCLVDAGHYGASLDEPEMHYLLEHWGEVGAESQHERNAIDAVNQSLNDEDRPLIVEGIYEFLDSLCALWDVLDTALLQSGIAESQLPDSRRPAGQAA